MELRIRISTSICSLRHFSRAGRQNTLEPPDPPIPNPLSGSRSILGHCYRFAGPILALSQVADGRASGRSPLPPKSLPNRRLPPRHARQLLISSVACFVLSTVGRLVSSRHRCLDGYVGRLVSSRNRCLDGPSPDKLVVWAGRPTCRKSADWRLARSPNSPLDGLDPRPNQQERTCTRRRDILPRPGLRPPPADI